MKTFILGDSRMQFQADISTALMLDSYPFEVIQAKNFEEVSVQADQNRDAIIVISDSMVNQYDPDRLRDRVVYGYVSNPNMVAKLQELGINCIGLHKTSKSLLGALTQEQLPVMQAFNTARPQQTSRAAQTPKPKAPEPAAEPVVTPSAPPQQSTQPIQPQQPQQPQQTQETPPSPFPGMNISPEMMMMFQMMAQQMAAGGNPFGAQNPQQAASGVNMAGTPQTPVQQSSAPPPDPEPGPEPEAPAPVKTGGKSIRNKRNQHEQAEVDAAIDEDLLTDAISKSHKTKVITVYAAKGGVGKTSISTELATCLALTSNGRRKFRVCIVDYNIDFGDVATTLMLDEQGPNMTYWASEIREMLACGKKPEEIRFERKQIENYFLQQVSATGLYALAAPIMHEDSMFIKSEELDIMLDNLVENGGFDYIVCDTGNNTRDSSVIAIDKSDYVLLVATQDVTTANCNASVLRTLRDTGFDTDKVRLVINNVMSAHETGISVQEVEETFPYECVCRIKATRDIIRANNLGQPLVYKPGHEYTKQIQRIVRFVTEGEVPTAAPKKGLFSRFKKK